MKIALVQTRCHEDVKANIEHAVDLMDKAHTLGAKLICFPLLQFYKFFPMYPRQEQPFCHAEAINGSTVQVFIKKAAALSMVVILNIFERFNDEFYNTSVVIDDDGKLLGGSRMVHICNDGLFYNKDYYTPSNSNFRVFHTGAGKIGIINGFDMHFSEAARILAINDAQVIVIPSAHINTQPLDIYEAEIKAMAFQNCVYVAMVNRVGQEDKMDFAGQSIMVDPDGQVIKKGDDSESIIVADIDFTQINSIRQKRPYLKLRRPDEYFNIIKLSVD
ncbi:MAG: carbon-nitrogen hydrolase family protein [Mahellales bacterium]|jgi:predicted amidohydrolase